jgi:hypothetical protein
MLTYFFKSSYISSWRKNMLTLKILGRTCRLRLIFIPCRSFLRIFWFFVFASINVYRYIFFLKRWKWWWIRRCFILVDWWWRGRLVRTVSPIFNTVWPFAILIVQVICWRMKLKYWVYHVYLSQFSSRGRGRIWLKWAS